MLPVKQSGGRKWAGEVTEPGTKLRSCHTSVLLGVEAEMPSVQHRD